MADLLDHRGPDDRGVFAENGVALGFRRLSIFDPTVSGHQPMVSADARHVIVFNGAIYNFVELRAELEALGHRFRSNGDTEVLLAAYQQWGRGCLPKLNGMWAFLIYDRQQCTLFGSRDRFGVKPLFWSESADRLLFASEIKAIRAIGQSCSGLDLQRIAAFLVDGDLDVDDRTFYGGVLSVPPGTAFEWRAGEPVRWFRYWSLLDEAAKAQAPADPVTAFRELFDDAIRLRMRSDVPLGVQLSGGLDSTAIITRMAEQFRTETRSLQGLMAFCYMDQRFDESHLIRESLDQTGATLFMLESTPHQLWETIAEHLRYQDEPVHSFSSVVGFRLMGLARSQGIKVILNGQGADEVLGGYPSYFNEYWAELIRTGRWVMAASGMRDFAGASGKPLTTITSCAARTAVNQMLAHIPGYRAMARRARSRSVCRTNWLSPELTGAWRNPDVETPDTLNGWLRYSVERSPLPMHLRAEDRNSMAHGLELRLPFLDYRLVTLAFALGAQWKISGPFTKILLRQAMHGRIPESIRSRVQKFGFPTSIDTWFRGELYEPLRDLLASSDVRQSGLWNVPQLERDLDLHRSGVVNLGPRLFDIAQISLLLRMQSAGEVFHRTMLA